ncbi:M3 family metallopeptidase [Plebeiibacterium sediminum]|uniref:Dipeptidyl carboxypeptidase n=1 Tax=Plebeiibacterium sediminum TaxID=2992112 RepID=A0AAE3M1R3_9BACT|nr:M3 family metallopeptidase [Plebeiobacterium sediminum]MCW3785509.1 M3 family metallopeptidase [Plebeiobacterium sediminum]
MKRLKLTHLYLFLLVVAFTSCQSSNQKDSELENNYLLKESNLPYGVPDFSKINSSDFLPAMEYGINEKLAELKDVAENPSAPTFDNVFIPIEKSGRTLARVSGVFGMLSGAYTNDTIQQAEEELAPKLSGLADALFLNDTLFKKVETIYNQLEQLDLDAESKKLVEEYYQRFILSGANLSQEDKEQLKAINGEIAQLSTKFANQLISAAKNAALVVDSAEELDGLSEGEIKAAQNNATKNNLEGKYQLPLQNTTQQPYLTYLKNRDTREKLFKLSWYRAEKGDENDTRSIIVKIAQLRAKKANILGCDNYAEWTLKDQMAKTPKAALDFLDQLVDASIKNGKTEAKELQKLIDREKGGFKLAPWDWNYYAEKLRKEKYDLNEDEIKPYFELFTVVEKGVFYAAEKLYGISFKPRTDVPVYSDDVKVYELFNQDGSTIGLFYCDYFKRDNKSGGAWMSNLVEQSTLLGTKPVIYNVCNYTKPAAGEPALISYDDVTTLFHEFGHALHGFFANQKYVTLSGTNVSRDFVELPSQFNEHWALYPEVFKNYAIHYKTGEPMPESLITKIKNASTFNQGYMLTELLAAAELDLQWHTISADTKIEDAPQFETQALNNTNLNIAEIPPRYRSPYFLHIWGNGYAAGYYAYLWAEMLDNDAFEWFNENGGLTRANGDRFREMILSRGNTEDFDQMYQNFTGRKPNIAPMLKHRGILK